MIKNMKQVSCKNCGAVYDENLAKCPYCGTMNKKGAYRQFRLKIVNMIDGMLGLKDDVQRSVSRTILLSFLRSLILIAIVIGLAFIASRFAKVNYYNDKEYDEKAYETILWEDENLEKLEEAYQGGDYKTIEKLYYENSKVVSSWAHYPSYCLRSKYQTIMEEGKFDKFKLEKVLYFLYYPEYYTGYNTAKKIDREEYADMKKAVIDMTDENGFPEEKLKEIYEKHADEYGYISSYDLEEYFNG